MKVNIYFFTLEDVIGVKVNGVSTADRQLSRNVTGHF